MHNSCTKVWWCQVLKTENSLLVYHFYEVWTLKYTSLIYVHICTLKWQAPFKMTGLYYNLRFLEYVYCFIRPPSLHSERSVWYRPDNTGKVCVHKLSCAVQIMQEKYVYINWVVPSDNAGKVCVHKLLGSMSHKWVLYIMNIV